ncbi:MAG: hypothetical protein QNJ15_04485 [Erythrobacter sp.]|nr:hypothetical protein [Erythrobacter sp.]
MTRLETAHLAKAFAHHDAQYQILVWEDPEAYGRIIVKALRNGKEFLLTLPGGIPARVRYDVSFETAEKLQDILGVEAVEYFVSDLESKIREFA